MRFLSFLLTVSAFAADSANGLDMARLQTIRPRLQALVDDQTIPGAVALVARHGKVALVGAVGWRDVENKKPMQADSIFQIMSMTKNFTGVAVMMLMEDGRIELRQPIAHYLPEFRGIEVEEKFNGPGATHPPKHPPTVWELMDHTSGLRGEIPKENWRIIRVRCAFLWLRLCVSMRTRICNSSRARDGATATWVLRRWAG